MDVRAYVSIEIVVSWYPYSWLIIAVIFSASSLAISSALSVSREVSLWGSVPGQDGYAAYTLFAYVLFFGVMVTHLKTKDQLWRLVGAVVLMGVFLSGFAVFQHYPYDPLQLMEHPGSARVTSTAGYPIFAGALLLMTISLSLVLAGVHLKEPLRERRFWLKMSLWVQVITIQALGLLFTLSRGPWVGTIIALLVFLTMVTIFMGWRTLVRLVAVIAATAALMAGVVSLPGREGQLSSRHCRRNRYRASRCRSFRYHFGAARWELEGPLRNLGSLLSVVARPQLVRVRRSETFLDAPPNWVWTRSIPIHLFSGEPP